MKNILVPTDFSPAGRRVVLEAAKLAVRLKAKLHVIHVYGAMKRADTILSVNKLLKREADEKFAELLVDLLQLDDLDMVHKAVRGTEVAETIDRIARQIEASLLVIGSTGEMNAPEILLGSVTGRLLKRTNTPLLIIPQGQTLPKIKSILLGVKSLDLDDPGILQPLFSFQDVFEANIHPLKVRVGPREPAIVGDEIPSSRFGQSVREIEARTIYEGIERELADHPRDLLCVIRRKRGFFELMFRRSQIKKSTFNAEIPMLVLQGDR